jgi:VCBS repeat-containing protein
VTYSQQGDTLTATAGDREVFTVTLNGDGTFTYTLKDTIDHQNAQGQNVATLTFGLVGIPSVAAATDFDFDPTLGDDAVFTHSFDVNVIDDVPMAADDDGATVTEGDAAITGNVLLNDAEGADGATLTGFSYRDANGDEQTALAGETVETETGTLTVEADGSYTFAVNESVVHDTDGQVEAESFTYTLVDADGDTAEATATIEILDTNPEVDAIASDEAGNEDQWIQLNMDSALISTEGPENLTITISGVPEGARLNPGTEVEPGVWTATPEELPLVCILPPRDFSGDIDLTLTVSTTDVDGDTDTDTEAFTVYVAPVVDEIELTTEDATATFLAKCEETISVTQTLTVTVIDDTPSIVIGGGNEPNPSDDPNTVVVDEDDLPHGGDSDKESLSDTGPTGLGGGQVLADGDARIDGETGDLTYTDFEFVIQGPSGLTSDGDPISYTYDMGSETLQATAGGRDVFTVQLDGSGNFTFTLQDVLDHPNGFGENAMDLEFSLVGAPKDGILPAGGGQGGGTDDMVLTGTADDDVLNGGSGNDTITGLGGDDTIDGNAGEDLLIGDGGAGSEGGLTVVGEPTVIFQSSFEDIPDGAQQQSDSLQAPEIDGWKSSGEGVEIWQDTAVRDLGDQPDGDNDAADGSVFVELNNVPSDNFVDSDGIYRDVPTEEGKVYELTFSYSGRPGYDETVNKMAVSVDGDQLGEYSHDMEHESEHDWQTVTVRFTGTGEPMRIEFSETSNNDDANGRGMSLDNIILTDTGTVETPAPTGSFDDTIYGGANDDTIFGNQGDDVLYGDDPNPTAVEGCFVAPLVITAGDTDIDGSEEVLTIEISDGSGRCATLTSTRRVIRLHRLARCMSSPRISSKASRSKCRTAPATSRWASRSPSSIPIRIAAAPTPAPVPIRSPSTFRTRPARWPSRATTRSPAAPATTRPTATKATTSSTATTLRSRSIASSPTPSSSPRAATMAATSSRWRPRSTRPRTSSPSPWLCRIPTTGKPTTASRWRSTTARIRRATATRWRCSTSTIPARNPSSRPITTMAKTTSRPTPTRRWRARFETTARSAR